MQFIDINNNNKTLTTIEEEEQFFKKKNNCGIIYFYEPEHLFGFLSNFYPSPFIASTTTTSSTTDNNKNFNNNNNNTSTTTTEIIEWKTSEHFYQAHKFTQNKEIFNEIQTSSTPKEAFELSRKYQFKIDNNNNNIEWNDERKEKIMMEALINKFLYSKNKELLNRLIQLKGFYLVENSFVDSYWGIGSDGKGKNRLGILLMKLIENVVNK
ncbi:hypothetical protein ABK040_013331 [Willaertia magna]